MTRTVIDPDDQARVWSQVEIKVNLGNYESATFSVGCSRTCRDTDSAIKRMQEKIARQNEAQVAEVMEKFKTLAAERE